MGSPSCRSGIPLGEWLIYPSIRIYSIYSDNLFLAPSDPVNAWAFGATPSITANWTNGIHTTTIYAKYDTERYPTDNMIDTSDRQVTFSQKYSPLPDLTFSAVGDYSHADITTSLTEINSQSNYRASDGAPPNCQTAILSCQTGRSSHRPAKLSAIYLGHRGASEYPLSTHPISTPGRQRSAKFSIVPS